MDIQLGYRKKGSLDNLNGREWSNFCQLGTFLQLLHLWKNTINVDRRGVEVYQRQRKNIKIQWWTRIPQALQKFYQLKAIVVWWPSHNNLRDIPNSILAINRLAVHIRSATIKCYKWCPFLGLFFKQTSPID